MTVTRSTAAERAVLPTRAESRFQETIFLLAGSITIAVGLGLVYQAKAHSFFDIAQQLEHKQLLNLNEISNRNQLLPFLSFLTKSADQKLAAQKIFDYLGTVTSVPNVGALSQVHIDAHKRLFTAAQLAQLKPFLVVRTPAQFRREFFLWTLLYFAGFYLVHAVWRALGFEGDRLLLPVIHLLTGAGLIVMLSLREAVRDRMIFIGFAQGVIVGCVLMLLLSRLDYERLFGRLSFVPLLASFLLSTALILFGTGPGASDAKVNLFGFQPVEAIRILLVFFLAGYFAARWEFLREVKERRRAFAVVSEWVQIPRLEYVLPVIIGMGGALLFFFLQKDLGPALVIACLFLALYGIARNRTLLVWFGLAILLSGFALGYLLHFPQTVSERVQMWLSPWDNGVRGGDQIAHSLWAMATGGASGTGLGLGNPALVPVAHTDLILSALGEELGFAGLLAIFVLYALLIYRGFRIAQRARSDYGFFLSLGLVLVTALQILLIAAGILDLIPLSGVVSPFLSYGRTSMLANFVLFAMLLSISRRPGSPRRNAAFQQPVRWLGVLVGCLGAVVVAKAAYVQLFRSDAVMTAGTLVYQADGVRRYQYNPRILEVARQIPRGVIYDRNSVPLATSNWNDLEAHRSEYEKLGISIEQACSRSASRHYPFGGLTFHLLGDLRTRVNWGATNTSLQERDSIIRLQGYDDRARNVELKEPRTGKITHTLKYDYRELVPLVRYRYQPAHKSVQRILNRDRDVHMTIDIRLQQRAAEILRNQLRRTGTQKGAVIVLDPVNGDLLASVSYPYPVPLEPAEDSLLDRARYGLYPPGSTFKLVTAIAALRTSPRLVQDTFECKRLEDGRVGNYVQGWARPVRDDVMDETPHGTVNLEKGIIVSCNAFFAQLGTYRIGPKMLFSTADLLGIQVAQPNTPEKLREAIPQASYGQGQVRVTPLQMARVAATVASRGAAPFGRWVTDDTNSRTQTAKPVLSPDLAQTLAHFMRLVVTNGTGRRLSAVSIPIAGKTGTAEIQNGRSHAWFAGFAPYNSPDSRRIAFAVLIENGQYGGAAAAPVAGELVIAARDLGIVQ